ncbi:hypothetical protein GCM10007421_17790 [Halopseudomonas oceani]|uniref:CENP-V/GFA domain-containing protein n=1 Tax=Halopseudomonas oceani TaxID=1708783 RepID=A0A2P4EUZ7_9GAMM|nr:DUF6151 family protein [Halopseudomonas oceani]POB03398.1 hypothetical protein C1949_09980 [Halopseudomonas oceani]GGE44037.1 hypothetical protein GCM10007421_17790 [Halopseudomonas oceani]
MDNLALQCQCGTVRGRAIKVYPVDGTRVVCYCRDCQAFAHALNAADRILDAEGGTDIYQLPPARLQIHHGHDQIRCLRLSEKGLYRWYAGCCNTPIGNTLGPGMPLVGLIHAFISDPDAEFKTGPVRALVNLSSATGTVPREKVRAAPAKGYMRKILFKIALWKLGGKTHPNPFFAGKKPITEPQIVSPGSTV